MASILKSLRLLADPNRLRILLLLAAEELSVAELQEILGLGQSTISTQLSQLKQAGLVEDRRTGKNISTACKSPLHNNVLPCDSPGCRGDSRSRTGPGRVATRTAQAAGQKPSVFR